MDVMTNWLSTVMTRRPRSTRHIGAGFDADMLRMAHELSLMEQGTKTERIARKTLTNHHNEARIASMRQYPNHSKRMADRSFPYLSSR